MEDANRLLETQVREMLLAKQYVLGTAESCTGGYIASIITSVAGSSAYFAGSVVSYSNAVKQQVLGVSEESLKQFGAVSRPVVEQMVSGAIRVLGCDCAVATSGIAGPDGGMPDKPVGTVWIAAAVKNKISSECFHFKGDRIGNIHQSAEAALYMLLQLLDNE